MAPTDDELIQVCQECFLPYTGPVEDGFCSDECSKRYELELLGEDFEVNDDLFYLDRKDFGDA